MPNQKFRRKLESLTQAAKRIPLDPVTFAVLCLDFVPDPWQSRFLRSRSNRILLNCSRQSGKSTTTAVLALWEALYKPHSVILIDSPSLRQSQETMLKVQQFLSLLQIDESLDSDTKLSAQFSNGSRILALPGSQRTIRGVSAVTLLIDNSKSIGYHQASSSNALDLVRNLCERFPLVVRQLRTSCRDHEPFYIKNEYGVQYLFHAILRLYFDDIIAEAVTPTYAGGSAKIDFLLRPEKIGVETQMSRSGLGAKELGDELIEDIARYKAHPDCKVLICFVYDPEESIANPRGIESDLNKLSEEINVQVFIKP